MASFTAAALPGAAVVAMRAPGGAQRGEACRVACRLKAPQLQIGGHRPASRIRGGARPLTITCVATDSREGGGKKVQGKPPMPGQTTPPKRRSASESAVCHPAFVLMDNTSDSDYTVMTLEVTRYPGLLRSVAWLLNGLDLLVQEATISTDIGKDVFWLQTLRGRKLSDEEAEELAERVRDHVMYCQPDEATVAEADVFSSEFVEVNNYLDPEHTVMTVTCPTAGRPGFMLELVTAITALGITILEGFVTRSECLPEEVDCLKTRTFKFGILDHQGKKVDYVIASGLIFTVSVLIDKARVRNFGAMVETIEMGRH